MIFSIKKIFSVPERKWVLPVISGVFIILIPVVTAATVIVNRSMNAYIHYPDTIIIPVIHSVSIAILFFLYLLVINIIALIKYGNAGTQPAVKSKFWFAAGILLSLPGILTCLLMIFYWFSLNHLPVILTYIYGIIVILKLMFSVMSKGPLIKSKINPTEVQ